MNSISMFDLSKRINRNLKMLEKISVLPTHQPSVWRKKYNSSHRHLSTVSVKTSNASRSISGSQSKSRSILPGKSAILPRFSVISIPSNRSLGDGSVTMGFVFESGQNFLFLSRLLQMVGNHFSIFSLIRVRAVESVIMNGTISSIGSSNSYPC